MEIADSLKGQFIVAMPTLKDPKFMQSVVLICEHNDQGAMGVIVNRPANIYLQEVLEQVAIPVIDLQVGKQIIFMGGPLDEGYVCVLHENIGSWDSSISINQRIKLTTSRDILEAIACDRGPENHMVALGYAGWGPGQLELEVTMNIWLHMPACKSVLFEIPANKRWSVSTELMGVNHQQLSLKAGHA